MPSHLPALFLSIAIAATAGSAESPANDAASTGGASTGLVTDHLSPKEQKAWRAIEAVVTAEDDAGRPLHPTLHGLWETVQTSSHTVRIEIVRTKKSAIVGRFEVTQVDPDGAAHEARLLLNLRALDRVSTRPAAARANGFIPFKGLDETERRAELLGHELAHAVWHLESVERARIAERIHREKEELVRKLLAAETPEDRQALTRQARQRDRFGRAMEETAERLEQQIWKELVAVQ